MNILIDGQTLQTPEMGRGIGRTFLTLCQRLVSHITTVNWSISVAHAELMQHFSKAVREQLLPHIITGSDYTQAIQTIIDRHHIDIYWNPNPLMLNVHYPQHLKNVAIYVTVYDLIPKVMATLYQKNWPTHQIDEYNRRLHAIADHADHILPISQHTLQDYCQGFPQVKNKINTVCLGVNSALFPPRRLKLSPDGIPYILYVGGFDPRKNLDGALQAFAKLVAHPTVDPSLQFYIVCSYNDEAANHFYQQAAKYHVANRVKLLGQVSDTELREYYANAQVFFFPSLYEGFGLPILEALASATTTVSSNTSSLPEVGGDAVLYCDPTSPENMAEQLLVALNQTPEQLASRQECGLAQAQQFNWNQTTLAYKNIFQSSAAEHNNTKPNLKIAVVTPWPPEQTGVAHHTQPLIENLQTYCDITLYVNYPPKDSHKNSSIHFKNLEQLKTDSNQYDFIFYQLGNNSQYHTNIYKLAWEIPGIITLHDYNIQEMIKNSFLNTKDEYLYEAAYQESYGENGAARYNADTESDLLKYPYCEAIIKRSKAVIVHNAWVRRQLAHFANIYVVPLGAVIHKQPLLNTTREQIATHLGISNEYVIGVFGFVNHNKRLPTIIEAIGELYRQGYPCKLLIVGEVISDINVAQLCQQQQIPYDIVKITGYVTDEVFEQYMAFCDIFVNLRKPSRGETSGPLSKALAMGKPCIVSDYQQFATLPDDICLKVSPDEYEVQTLTAFLSGLMKDPAVRLQLSKNAIEYMEHYATNELAAKQYYELCLHLLNHNTPRVKDENITYL